MYIVHCTVYTVQCTGNVLYTSPGSSNFCRKKRVIQGFEIMTKLPKDQNYVIQPQIIQLQISQHCWNWNEIPRINYKNRKSC